VWWKYSFTLSSTLVKDGVGGQRHAPAAFVPEPILTTFFYLFNFTNLQATCNLLLIFNALLYEICISYFENLPNGVYFWHVSLLKV